MNFKKTIRFSTVRYVSRAVSRFVLIGLLFSAQSLRANTEVTVENVIFTTASESPGSLSPNFRVEIAFPQDIIRPIGSVEFRFFRHEGNNAWYEYPSLTQNFTAGSPSSYTFAGINPSGLSADVYNLGQIVFYDDIESNPQRKIIGQSNKFEFIIKKDGGNRDHFINYTYLTETPTVWIPIGSPGSTFFIPSPQPEVPAVLPTVYMYALDGYIKPEINSTYHYCTPIAPATTCDINVQIGHQNVVNTGDIKLYKNGIEQSIDLGTSNGAEWIQNYSLSAGDAWQIKTIRQGKLVELNSIILKTETPLPKLDASLNPASNSCIYPPYSTSCTVSVDYTFGETDRPIYLYKGEVVERELDKTIRTGTIDLTATPTGQAWSLVSTHTGEFEEVASIILTGVLTDDTTIVQNDVASTMQAEEVNIDVRANDVNPFGYDFWIFDFPLNDTKGHATKSADVVNYKPDSGYCGEDIFTYRVKDNFGNISAPASVTVNIVCGVTAVPRVTLNKLSDTSIQISWEADPMAGSYELRKNVNGGEWISVPLQTPSDTSKIEAISSGSLYTFEVRACNQANECSGWSNTANYFFIVNGLAISRNSNSQVTVSWPKMADGLTYRMQRVESISLVTDFSTANWQEVNLNGRLNDAGGVMSFIDTAVSPNKHYYYRIKACNGASQCQ